MDLHEPEDPEEPKNSEDPEEPKNSEDPDEPKNPEDPEDGTSWNKKIFK